MPVTAMRTRPVKRTTMRHTVIRRMITPIIIMAMVITMLTTTTIIITMTSIASMTITTAIPMLMKTNKPPGKRRSVVPEAVGSSAAPVPDPADLPESEAASLYRLMTWLSPSFPVGAFSYSSGIEWAVEAGDVTDAASLRQWLASLLTDGGGICDGIFLAHTLSGCVVRR